MFLLSVIQYIPHFIKTVSKQEYFVNFIPIRNGIESTNPFHTHCHSVIKDMYGTREQTAGQAGSGSGLPTPKPQNGA